MENFVQSYYWELFIFTEVIAVLCIVLFTVFRYILGQKNRSLFFLGLFLISNVIDAVVAYYMYTLTGEIEAFQMIVGIFLLYACTFGYRDFKRLDRWLRTKIEHFTGKTYVTDQEKRDIEKASLPEEKAKQERRGWYLHAALFLGAFIISFFYIGEGEIQKLFMSLDWLERWFNDTEQGPFSEAMANQVFQIWFIIFVVDSVIVWSYTLFPEKSNG
ncbi:hypothetical protein ACM26V_20955 [Salipaludibacillus sp. HK11]|uniref:hypothetical protein n=1 Tax=Salipaludibacillus sp. HK11 TaxID=3394320 RepID=UPI0039FC7C24